MIKALRLVLLLIGVLVVTQSSSLAVSYRIVDLGTFSYNTVVTDMNRFGQIVGTVSESGTGERGFIWSQASGFSYLTTLDDYDLSRPQAINNSGQVVGYAEYDGYRTAACLWEEGKPVQYLGALPSGQFNPGSIACGMNSKGQVVGYSTSDQGYTHAFVWSAGTGVEDIHLIGAPGNSGANDINDEGVVVGGGNNGNFIWTRDDGRRELDAPGVPRAINKSGQVILAEYYTWGLGGSYIWRETTGAVSLGILPTDSNYSYCAAHDINNLGQVVGASNDHPFIWDSTSGIQELPAPDNCWRTTATCVNDSGLIAGYAEDGLGNTHILLWTPVPEPSSLCALGVGLASLCALARRRSRRG